MTDKELCAKLIDIVDNYKTIYATGCFGWRMTDTNKQRALNTYPQNKEKRYDLIMSADSQTFAFDCVCLIKAILWGWCGDMKHTYGGAKYCSNGVPDCTTEAMLGYCSDVSTDFTNIVEGELVWIEGHVGIYIGKGKVVECTSKWTKNVLISNLGNISEYRTGRYRKWTKHGKLPWIEYTKCVKESVSNLKSNKEIAIEVIKGLWGNGSERKRKLTQAGYDYTAIQKLVNKYLQ